MKEIVYNKEIFEVIDKLSEHLLKSVLLKKDENNVSVKMKATSVFVELTTPISNFDFEGDVLAFAEGVYEKYFKFFNCFKNPSLTQNENTLTLKEGKNVIKFRVSDPELIEEKQLFNGLKKQPESVTKINLDMDQFQSIRQMIKMISSKDSEDVTFNVKKKVVVITVANPNTKNSYDFQIDLEEEATEEVEFSIKANIFNYAPKLNYEVNITKTGFFIFKSVNENFELNLYTGMKG